MASPDVCNLHSIVRVVFFFLIFICVYRHIREEEQAPNYIGQTYLNVQALGQGTETHSEGYAVSSPHFR